MITSTQEDYYKGLVVAMIEKMVKASLSNISDVFKATYHDALNEEYSGGSLLLNRLKRGRE